MADKFPGEISEPIGQFRVVPRGGSAEDPDVQQRTGVLRFRDKAIELEVSPAFTPVVSWTERRPGMYAGSPPQGRITDDAVLLGVVASNPGEVSLWGLDTVAQRSFGVPMPGRAELSREVVAADWCLVGAHFPSDQTEFSAVTLDMTGLHRFAALPSIRVEMPERGMVPLRWVYDPPDAATGSTSAPLPGQVRLDPLATMPTLGGPDVSVTSNTRLKLEFEGALPLSDVMSDIAIPMTSLLTILSGTDCRVRGLNVSTPEKDRSADVYGDGVDPAAPRDTADLLLTLDHVDGADFIGRWLDLAKRTSPVPQILAAAYAGEFTTVDSEALSLCAAAETLHRRLYPDARRWTAETVTAGESGLDAADLPDEVRQALRQALGQFMFEPSFPMRVAALAQRVGAVLPGCVGRVNRWKQAVTNQRNILAHGLPDEDCSFDVTRMHYITRSLRWVLTLYLLLEAGAPADQLASITANNRRYERDQRNWRRVWPKVFTGA